MKPQSLRIAITFGIHCLMLFSAARAGAFSLLGPFESWMEYTNGLQQIGDIGGPMCISNEYRWNVPVVTYGFDQSFRDYFGTDGVAAVESAIQVINNLPPASQMTLTNIPFNTTHFNAVAQAAYLLDLKSTTLALLLEQLGLAQPTRYVFVLQQWNPAIGSPDWTFPEYLAQFNFDPTNLSSTPYVDNALYSGALETEGNRNSIITFPVLPGIPSPRAVADRSLETGAYYSGLTYDDIGGLRYLYSTNTIEAETLPPDVRGVKGRRFVDVALRPGINKIMFMPQPMNLKSRSFLPVTIRFVDDYITNGVTKHQSIERTVKQPDFLFRAGDVEDSQATIYDPFSTVPLCERTGTEGWMKNAALNQNSTGGGPGVIQPPIIIMFNKLKDEAQGGNIPILWGTYDGTTNLPIVYPVP